MRFCGRDMLACVLAGAVVAVAVTSNEAVSADQSRSASVAAVAEPISTPASKIKTETLLRANSSWDGVAYSAYPAGQPELSVVRLTIPAHTALPWHTHPMPNAAYVVSGSITVEKQSDGSRRTLRTGEVLAEMVDTPHRGVTGDDPVVLMVFYAGSPDLPWAEGH